LKCLRLDNAGEYCNKEFDDYCSYHGIHRERPIPGTPQENGVLERMNRTIMEHARSMRLHDGFPLQLWADVVDTIVYLINRRPSSSLDGRIPKEVLLSLYTPGVTWKKPSIHLVCPWGQVLSQGAVT
jgi:transposase InsO family protein